jgi:SAM-dependent methyltransferase
MEVNVFFDLLVEEIRQNPALRKYYRFLESSGGFEFRKAYFCQRLQYIKNHVGNSSLRIWDCGCGYGTTGFFLALNNISSYGSTLEFYFKRIPERIEYWKKFGDVSLFSYNYENLFDNHPAAGSKDLIIIQDTLHHLEPLQDALRIFSEVLAPEGRLLIVEENGNNVIQNLKLFLRRGNKRIIEMYDETLKKNILLGNENIRGLDQWKKELARQHFRVVDKETQYIRFYPPFAFKEKNVSDLIEKEQQLWKKSASLKEYLFFGLSFIAEKEMQYSN